MGFAMRILEQPLVLIEGVEETLEELATRHSLTLFTKGHPDEQRLKIDQSGLGSGLRIRLSSRRRMPGRMGTAGGAEAESVADVV